MMRTRLFRGAMLAACFAGLMACERPAPPAEVPGLSGEAAIEQRLTMEVDPLHGAAFERPRLQATLSGAMRLSVEVPSVRHDPSTNRTTVTLALTNAGDALTYLKGVVQSSKRLLSPAGGFSSTATRPGSTQTLDLVFDNPGGGSFEVDFGFYGAMVLSGGLAIGPGAPTTPSTGPSTGPSTAPPSSTAPAGGSTMSASSSYGTLTPDQAFDGDLATMWACDGYQAPGAWLGIDMGAIKTIDRLAVKMKPQASGAFYTIQVSTDGTTFKSASGPMKNTTWNLETKTFAPVSARFVRLSFTNDPAGPETRFVVYELKLDGVGPISPSPSPSSGPSAEPSSPPATGALSRSFDSDATGADPADFVDPRQEGYAYDWMPPVSWKVDNLKRYVHEGLNDRAMLSFRRYRGGGLGTANGLLPSRYFAELDVTPLKSYTYAPTGDQGTQFYYLDPTHYLELLIKPTYFEVWVADGAVPFQSRGWQRLYFTSLNTSAGQTRRLGAEVDTTRQQIKVFLDGKLMTTLGHAILTTRGHYFALRGAGNVVAHDNLRIEPR